MSKIFKIETQCPRCKEENEITADSSMLKGYESIHKLCPECRLGLIIHYSPGSDKGLVCWDAFRDQGGKPVVVVKTIAFV